MKQPEYYPNDEINDTTCIVRFKYQGKNEGIIEGGVIERPAWHCCAYRVTPNLRQAFTNESWGEDQAFSNALNHDGRSSHHIDEVLHFYTQNLLGR